MYDNENIKELQEKCRDRGLSPTGTKYELIDRLRKNTKPKSCQGGSKKSCSICGREGKNKTTHCGCTKLCHGECDSWELEKSFQKIKIGQCLAWKKFNYSRIL
jgi:hypothetical protein